MEDVQKPCKNKKNESRTRTKRQPVDVKEEERLRKMFQEVWGSTRATLSLPTESQGTKQGKREKTVNAVINSKPLKNVSPLAMMRSSLKKMKASSGDSPNINVTKTVKKAIFVHVDEPVLKKIKRTTNKKKKIAKLHKKIVSVLPIGKFTKHSSQKESCAVVDEPIADKKGRIFFESSSSSNVNNVTIIGHSGKAWTIDRASDPIILYPLVQKSVQIVNLTRSLGEQTRSREILVMKRSNSGVSMY